MGLSETGSVAYGPRQAGGCWRSTGRDDHRMKKSQRSSHWTATSHSDEESEPNVPDLRPLVRADDIAEVLDVTSRSVLRMAERGDFPCLRIGRRSVRFVPSDVELALGLPHGLIQRISRRRRSS